ncbi:hypothetical protein DPX16_10746 [Anabarilius grahami]|uniref:Uncharacterized protein n=1 Tax=Anabarilius grahami TaxID=495550 RepID=A0A3N0Z7L8_ANAGA|nr:hypothetical protein DPX16_10746 [Anabarilius grahami]
MEGRGCQPWQLSAGGRKKGPGVCDGGHRGPCVGLTISKGVLGKIGSPFQNHPSTHTSLDKAKSELYGTPQARDNKWTGGRQQC